MESHENVILKTSPFQQDLESSAYLKQDSDAEDPEKSRYAALNLARPLVMLSPAIAGAGCALTITLMGFGVRECSAKGQD